MRALLATLLFAAAARASQPYPAVIAIDLSLSYVPACSLCHVGGKTGLGTAQTPFALSMQARGLRGGDSSLIAPALAALARDNVDSDHDGVPDIAELIAGTDPNVSGSASAELRADPGYGCGTAGGASTAAFVAALFVLLFRRRRADGLGEGRRFGYAPQPSCRFDSGSPLSHSAPSRAAGTRT